MLAPQCKLCGERHWSRFPCSATGSTGQRAAIERIAVDPVNKVVAPEAVIAKAPVKQPVTRPRPVTRSVTLVTPPAVTPVTPSVTRSGKGDTPEERAAYMRDYRAKRRAAKAAKGG